MLTTLARFATGAFLIVGAANATTYNYSSGILSLYMTQGNQNFGNTASIHIAVTPKVDIFDGVLEISQASIENMRLVFKSSAGLIDFDAWTGIGGWLLIEGHQVGDYYITADYIYTERHQVDGTIEYEKQITASAWPLGHNLYYAEDIAVFQPYYISTRLYGGNSAAGTWTTNVPEPEGYALGLAGLVVVGALGRGRHAKMRPRCSRRARACPSLYVLR